MSLREPLLLASRSPRRVALLEAAGIPFDPAVPPDVDETVPIGVAPGEAVRALAERKARAGAERSPGRLVLGADTLVFLGPSVLGKPRDSREAVDMLRRLSGAAHVVASGVALCGPTAGAGGAGVRVESGWALTRVRFRPLTDAEIEAYVAGGEPLDKAGGYAIQGGAAPFVEQVDGRIDTVIGLPLDVVERLLARFRPA